jgi:CubicO group peptidase (beta-lactamase class C family)
MTADMRLKNCLLVVVTLFTLLASSSPTYSMNKDIEEEISRILEENNTTAASISMIESNGHWHTLAIGVADKTTERPVDADTLFRIGSISKIFTSLSILKLVEDGTLGLNDPIRDWVEEVEFQNPWENESPVRIVHLLSHTTGWDDLHMSEYAHNDPTPVSLRESFLVYPNSRTSRWAPGSRMSYCNSGPGVAAYIVEKSTGQSYEEYIEFNFFEPLGMETATFFQSDDYVRNSATLYQSNAAQPYWNVLMRPSGAINASANDMVQLLDFFIHSSNQSILSEESLDSMRQPQGSSLAESGLEVGHGLSHFIEAKDGYIWYGHSGGVNGGLADFKYIPELGIGYYVAINSNSGDAIYEITKLLKAYLTEDLIPPVTPYNADTTVDTEALAGYFRVVNPRNSSLYFIEYLLSVGRIESRPEGIALVGILDGSVDLYSPVNQSQYVDPLTGKIALTIAEDPLIGTVLHNEWFTLKPVSFLSVYGPLVFIAIWLMATIVILIKTIVLLILKLRKKQINGGFWTHALPLLQILSLGLFIRGFIGVMMVDFLADNRLISGLMAYGTILFLLLSIVSVVWFVFKREQNYHYYQSLVYSFMSLTIGIYLTNMGITGFQFF